MMAWPAMMHARMARGGGNRRLAGSRATAVARQPRLGGRGTDQQRRSGSHLPTPALPAGCRPRACGRPGSARARGALALPWEDEWDLGVGTGN
jgi:hypothetical protein